jgi:glycosyltransferase involved in cell wall biosynthesis
VKRPLVTFVIPTIKARKMFLRRAVNSIIAQDLKGLPEPAVEIGLDRERDGAAVTRNRLLDKVRTPWVAFLDDDDFLLPDHLVSLLDAAEEHDASVVYPMCRVIGAEGEELDLSSILRSGQPFSADELHKCNYIPVTSLVRTELALRARFGPPDHATDSGEQFEDYGFYLRLLDKHNAKFYHLPKTTWVWHHHARQTAGVGHGW